MQTRTYTERSNARRAARAAGLDPDTAVNVTEDGFEVRFPAIDDREAAQPSDGNGADHQPAARRNGSDDMPELPAALRRPPPTPEQAAELKVTTKRINSPERQIIMPKTSTAKSQTKQPKPAKGGDKTATLLKMLAGKGSTVEQLTKALGWLPHTLRARISRLAKPKKDGGEGLKIERSRHDGITTYRIAS